MPVIDDTIHTLEIKALRKQFQDQIADLLKRVEALEKKK